MYCRSETFQQTMRIIFECVHANQVNTATNNPRGSQGSIGASEHIGQAV